MGSVSGGRRLWPFKLTFVVGAFLAAGAVAVGVVSGADQPSISSDQPEYAPGDTVALTGAGWAADESVELLVDDEQGDAWSHEGELVAGEDGTVSDSFELPELTGDFTVTATAASGEATASLSVAEPAEPTPPPAPTAGPTLTTDDDEYTPGDVVALSGADWRAGDTVQVAVDDDADDAWEHSAEVTVEADGSFDHTFDLPSALAAGFTATATDPTDRSATAEFSASFADATQPYLVRFASGTSSETQAQVLAAAGAVDVSYIAPLRIHGVLLPGGDGLQISLDRLRSNPSVTRVEPDRTREAGATPNDAAYGDQWSLPKIGWNNVFGELSPSGSARVAILDTGVDGSHPDLDGNVVPGTSILDGSNGLSDPNGHGTALAGIVAAETHNGAGVAGVGFAGVEVMPVTVLDSDGTGRDSDIIEGVVYAAENDADVILMAFSNPGYSELLQAAIDYAWEEGAVLVAATGNDGSSAPQFPAGDRGVIGVSNTDENDALNGSSNFGQAVFLGAPGTSIATTSAGGGTATISGTSAAAAHVAGAAALVKAASGASNGVIVSRLARNAEPAGLRDQTGNGRLNLDRAIADTSTDSIQPAGADPLGGGGPIVGPYVAAAPSPDFDIAPNHVSGTGTHVFTALVRNTSNSSSNTARCIRVTLPASITVASASFVVANPGTGVGQTGNWTLTTGTNHVEVRTDTNLRRGIFGNSAADANWVRFEITANATATGTNNWTALVATNNTAGCSSDSSSDALAARVGGTFSRDYTADFRDASNVLIAAPTVVEDTSQAYRVRITRTAGTDVLTYAAVALPTCFTNITSISTTDSGSPNFSAQLNDNVLRLTSSSALGSNGAWVQVHFTATADCTAGAQVFRTAAWKNSSPQTAEGDIFKLQTGTGHPTLTVISANTPPVSLNDSYSTGEDTPLTVSAPGVLTNDTDAQPLTAVLDSAPANAASFALNANGSFSYTPNPNFNGTDSFTYHANDGTANGNVATVTITVTAVNDAPVASDDAATVAEDSGASSIDVLGNDTDADGHTLTVASVTDPPNGTAVDNDTNVTYSPEAGFCGTDTFDYTVSDGNGGTDTATVTVTVTCVNDAPNAVDDAASVAEDSGSTSIDVLANDTDADGDTLVVSAVTDPANGTATDNDSNVSYTPDANFCGTDTFDYTITDGNGGSDTATVTVTVTCVNDAPDAANDAATVAEDSGATAIDVLANDTDADADTLVVDSVTDPANGTATDGNTNVSYTPDANFCGTDSFDYTVSDGNGGTDSATVTVTVTCVNDAPNAVNDAATVAEDSGSTAIDVLGNDTDADGHALVVSGVTDPANGTATDDDTSAGYTPDADFCGTDTFDYSISDANGGTDTATVTVTVTCVNDAPVATDDAYLATEDTLLSVVAPGVLANDTDADDSSLTAELVDDVSDGTLALAPDGSFTYDPDANFCGSDSFTYRADDGDDESNVATVSITVICVNDAPNAANDAATVAEDSGSTTIDVLANDTDADGNALVVSSVTDPANGTATDNDSNVSYTPDANFCGTDTFDYTITDGNGGSDTATVTVTVTCVNDAPDAANDAATVAEDSGATAIDVLANDTDADADTLVVDSVTDPANGTATDGNTNVSYTPDANFCGTDSFDYTVSDENGGTDTASVTVTVTCVNDPPVANNDTYPGTEDTQLVVTAPGVLGNDTDVDDTALAAVLVGEVSSGTLALAADGSFTYDPDPNFCGADSFTYRADDGDDLSNVATVSLTIACVNDAPDANDDTYAATEDTQLVVTAPGVLGNDTDVEGSALTAALVVNVSNGALALAADGSFTYDPDSNFCGSDSFTYRANDGTDNSNVATVTITVACVNDAPAATDDAETVAEDSGATAIDVLANDTDVEGDALAVSAVTDPANGTVANNGTSVSYTPDANYCGADSFSYTVSDGNGGTDTATVSITVTCVNDAPVANDDTHTATEDTQLVVSAPGVLGNDTDVENDGLTAALVADVAHGALALAADGSFTYDPAANYCGPDSFTYRANDGTDDSNVANVSITVACVNDAPVANDDTASVAEDSGASVIDVLANDTDVEGGTLAVGSVAQPAHGSVVNNGGNVSYTPDDDYCGPDSFTYRATDGTDLSNVATVSITVTCVNDAPLAGDDAATVAEDSGATAIDVLADDTDVDGDSLTIAGASNPANGTVVITGGGTGLTYEPDANYCGADSFTYTVSDGNGGSDTATVSITVTCVNDVPVADAGGPYSGNEAATVELDGSGSDDVEGPVTYSWTITPQTGSANDPGVGATCSFVGGTTASSEKPKVSCTDDGIYDVALTVTDSNGVTDGDTTTLTLANVAPTVAKPTFDPTLLGCQTATTLKNISFSDPGTVDRPWTVSIDWGDGSLDTTYTTTTQGAQPNQMHVYATAGTFTATVTVTDKDLDAGSNTSSTTSTVFPYTVEFRPPVDGSNATTTVVNKMKNGRVVPVKVRIRDLCGATDMLDPSAQVRIKLTKVTGTGGTGDPVEEYADAGNSSGGTNLFRHGGDHWIYNLDTKALGLVINNRYRVDVFVNDAQATVTTWAILEPVK